MTNASLKTLIPALLLASCATGGRMHYWYADDKLSGRDVDQVLRVHPLPANQNISITNIGSVNDVSHHIVQIRGAESLHTHQNHDLTVFVYRGHGTMRIGNESFPIRSGDVLFVPRGIVHAFRNEDSSPAVAIVVFTPGFDGKDNVPSAEEKGK